MKTSTLLFSLMLAPAAMASDPVLGGAPGSLDLGPGVPGGSTDVLGDPLVMKVHPGESIQAALDHHLTEPGDTVLVMPGLYIENVVVSKPGITLRGRSGAIIQGGQVPDPQPDLNNGYLACIRVEADDVTVTGFTLYNGGFGVLGRAPAPAVGPNWGDNPDGDPVHRLTVTRNTMKGQRYDGVNILGDDAKVLGNTITHTRDQGVEYYAASTGSRTEISDNDFSLLSARGIKATNGQLICSDNRSDLSDYDLVHQTWDTSLGGGVPEPSIASGNQYAGIGGAVVHAQIELDGVEVLIEDNRATGGWEGIDVNFDDNVSASVTIRDNHVEDVISEGIDVSGGFAVLESNTILGCTDSGIDLSEGEYVLVNNVVRDSTDEGIRAREVSNTIFQDNDVRHSGQDGLAVDGPNNQIIDNTFSENGGDGIDIDSNGSVGTIVTGNTCKDNLYEGLDNSGTSTTIDDNTCQDNGGGLALDIAGAGDGGAGTVASFVGNIFTTGGMTTAGMLD